ncbi:MAG: hypothetical protein KF716_28890 [Anaerolineae bacterium]|nr:hypothetical protein [Anaerolineae bacterium]
MATSIFGLGDTAQASGDYAGGRSLLRQALEIAARILWLPLILAILVSISDLFLQTGENELAVELAALVVQHPASEPPTQSRARRLLLQSQRLLPPEIYVAAKSRGETDDVIAITSSTLDQLRLPKTYTAKTVNPDVSLGKSILVDPLSERELEILRLLADGLTNQQIADKLVIVLGTVKSHNSNIFSKLGVTNRTQAIKRARELNLL